MVRAPVVLGSYELIERIGEGGMAEVWKARARGPAGFEKLVVIKRVLPSLTAKPGFAELLVREAKISARLSHPNIAQVFELGEEGGAHYIAMEYVHGKDLGQAMTVRTTGIEGLSVPLRVWIVSVVAKALEHAHTRRGDDGRPLQIVHRDVSPQNVLLSYDGAVKVADFGIARADEQGLGRGEDPKMLRGKYAYMSPEQARGEALDRRSDVFGVGVVLFELLAGQRLFRGKTSQETLALVRRAHVPPLGPVGIDPSLHPILLRALAADREQRTPSAGALAKELTAWLFQRGEAIGEAELAEAMARMYPPEESVSPNKLRVDLMLRAYQDATAVSGPPAPAEEPASDRTAALPISRRSRVEIRRLAYLAVELREHDERAFLRAVDEADGQVFRVLDDLRLAAFGAFVGLDGPAVHAARAALAFRARLRSERRDALLPRLAVLEDAGRISDGVLLEPEDETLTRLRALLADGRPGEVRVPSTLAPELEATFRVVPDGEDAEVEAFRGRAERLREPRRRLPLVERREELRVLSEALVATAQGRPSILRIVGEAGAGKSRLLAELRTLASPSDFTFVTAHAEAADAEQPYALLADLVRDLTGIERDDAPADRFAKVERLRILGLETREVRLLGELLGLHYPTPARTREGRPRGVEIAVAVRKGLAALARDRALVLVLEDLQWCDDASRQILPLVARGLGRCRASVLVTARPGLVTPRFLAPRPGAASGGTARPHALRALRVAPLGPEGTARLVAASRGLREAPLELSRAMHEASGGLPGWVELALERAGSFGAISPAAGSSAAGSPAAGSPAAGSPAPGSPAAGSPAAGSPAAGSPAAGSPAAGSPAAGSPDTLASSMGASGRLSEPMLRRIEGWLGPLDATERGLLTSAAAHEAPIPVALLLAVEGLLGDTGHGVLRRLLSRRLLVDDAPAAAAPAADPALVDPLGPWGGHAAHELPSSVRIAAGLVREALMSSLGDADRERLHDRLLSALERSGGLPTGDEARAAMLAHHASRGSQRRRAVDYLRLASEAAEAAGAGAAAARHCLGALRLLHEETGAERETQPAMALRGLDLALAAGDLALAVELAQELEAALPGPRGPDDDACLACASAQVMLEAGDGAAALERLRGIRETAAPRRAQLGWLRGRAFVLLGDLVQAESALAAAADAFGDAGDAVQEGRALALLADVRCRRGALGDAQQALARLFALAARRGDPQLRVDSLAALGAEREAAGDARGALARFGEALEVAIAARLEADRVPLSLRAALAALRADAPEEASAHARAAIELARSRQRTAEPWLGAAVQATVAALRAPDPAHLRAIERSAIELEALARPLELSACLELLARAERALGRAEAAEDAARRAIRVAERAGWSALVRQLGG